MECSGASSSLTLCIWLTVWLTNLAWCILPGTIWSFAVSLSIFPRYQSFHYAVLSICKAIPNKMSAFSAYLYEVHNNVVVFQRLLFIKLIISFLRLIYIYKFWYFKLFSLYLINTIIIRFFYRSSEQHKSHKQADQLKAIIGRGLNSYIDFCPILLCLNKILCKFNYIKGIFDSILFNFG